MPLHYAQMTYSANPLTSLMTLEQMKSLQANTIALTNSNLLGARSFFCFFKNTDTHAVLGLKVFVELDTVIANVFIYAQNNQGWKNLMKLSSAIETSERHSIPISWFYAYSQQCYVVVPMQDINKGDIQSLFAKCDPSLRRGGANYIDESYMVYCKEQGIPIVVVQEVRYVDKEDVNAFDVLVAIKDAATLESMIQHEANEYAQAETHFNQLPEDWIANTEAMLQGCRVTFEDTIHMPVFPVEDSYGELLSLCQKGLSERTQATNEYLERLDMELQVIKGMGYVDYFLVVEDFMRFAREKNIATGPGRGSSASSLVAYVLYITDVDPLEYDLLFERFLNPERVSLPDIDIDFEDGRRKEVVQYVAEKYGREYVAQIHTTGTLSMKAVARDVGRVFEFTREEMDFVSEELSGESIRDSWTKRSDEFHDFVMAEPRRKKWLRTASQLEGLPRTNSIHAAGVVISPVPIVDVVPLMNGQDGLYATQWSMKAVEDSGLVKMDFLGLKNLTLLKEIVSLTPEGFSLDSIDLEDAHTLNLFIEGNTFGIFQFESSGMQDTLRTIRPSSFRELATISALYRPGPMQYIPEYAERKYTSYTIHPKLESILKETNGIMVYQEQLMQVLSAVARYSYGEADVIRRAISKKDKNTLNELQTEFIQRATSDFTNQEAGAIYADILKFADYGFPKSHAIAYTLISFYLGYLKANFPQAFYSVLLNHSRGNVSKVNELLEEIRKANIQLLSPDIRHSELGCIPFEEGILIGLDFILQLPKDLKVSITEVRYDNIFELAVSMPKFNEPAIENLIKSNALCSFNNQRSLFETLPEVKKFATFNNGLSYNQAKLLGVPKVEEYDEYERNTLLDHEFQSLGFYLSGHPIQLLKERIGYDGLPVESTSDYIGQRIRLIGTLTTLKKIKTKKRDDMAFLDIQDETGTIPCVLFPRQFQEYKSIIKENEPYFVTGTVELRNNSPQLLIQHIQRSETV